MSERLARIYDELISYFLCEYPPTSPKRKLVDVVRLTASKNYASEIVENFLEKRLNALREELVNEYNFRVEEDLALRYEVADKLGEGDWIKGRKPPTGDGRVAFQDILHQVDPLEFEALAAIVLKRMGCQHVFKTPQSHDQGVDAFGYLTLTPELSRAVTHKLVWIAQAKHYITHGVSTNAVRELVGTNELLVSKIFSTVDARYKELDLRPYAPAALLLLTTHEMPSTVRRLAERAGVFVLEAADLFDLFRNELKGRLTAKSLASFIKAETISIPAIA